MEKGSMLAWKTYPSMISPSVSQEAKEWFIAIISLLFLGLHVDQHLGSSPLLTYLQEKCNPTTKLYKINTSPTQFHFRIKLTTQKLLTKKRDISQDSRVKPKDYSTNAQILYKSQVGGNINARFTNLTYFINYHYSTNATFLCKIQQRLKPKTNLLGS